MTTAKKFLAGVIAPIIVLFACTAWGQNVELVSRQDAGDGGAQGNDDSFIPAISADGRFIAFHSEAVNLIPGGGPDLNGIDNDVFVFDRATGALQLISRQTASDGGAQGNDDSVNPSISADGRYVAFQSRAVNLIPGGGPDSNGNSGDIFVYDRMTSALQLVSRQDAGDGGAQGNGGSGLGDSSISADGRFVAFESSATNLIPGGGPDSNGILRDIFVFDRTTGTLELVSRQDASAGGAQGNGNSSNPTISANGRYVVFTSSSTNLMPGGVPDTNGKEDVFVFDRTTGALELASRQNAADGGAQGNDVSGDGDLAISADGRYIAFDSHASNFIPGGGPDATAAEDIYVFDRTTGTLELVSRQAAADGGAQANGLSKYPSISADGRYVAFSSLATNLIPGGGPDANGSDFDVFVFDRTTGALEVVSRQGATAGGAQGNLGSLRPSISPDGRFVTFHSSANNLTPDSEPDIHLDIFVRDRLDEDGDHILDSVDTQPAVASADFSDFGLGGTTDGTLLDQGDQTYISIQDSTLVAPNDGIVVTTGANLGPVPAQIQACQGASQTLVEVSSDAVVPITCSSITVAVTDGTGTASLTFTVDGQPATATLDTGNEISFDPSTGELSAGENNTETIEVTIGGVVVSVDAGNTAPGTKDACKKGGWKTSTNPEFRNQGDCVSFFATGGKPRHNK